MSELLNILEIVWLVVQLLFYSGLFALMLAVAAVATLAPPIALSVVAWRRFIRPRLRAKVVVRTGEQGAG